MVPLTWYPRGHLVPGLTLGHIPFFRENLHIFGCVFPLHRGERFQEIITSDYKGKLHNNINFSPTIIMFYIYKGISIQNICCNEEWVLVIIKIVP